MKSKEKAPSDTKNRGNRFGGGNNFRREAFAGTSEALNALQFKFDCGEGNEGGRFLECIRLTMAYLSMNIEGDGNIETLIQNGKLFEPAWLDAVGPNPEATKDRLQAEYGTRAKRMEKLRINLSTAYGLVLGKCTDYLRSHLEGQERWEQTLNEQGLLELIKSIKSLLHRYDKDTKT